MRAGFLFAILLAASGYTWAAFAELSWLSSAGRLGPGFFPRLIGIALVVFCAWSLADDLRRGARERLPEFWRVTLAVAGLAGLFCAALEVLGGALSMVLFMAASLAYLNRGKPLQNALIALALPLAIYLLFRLWLGAAVPRGLLLPF